MKITLRWLAALLALSFAVAACGSDSDETEAGANADQAEADAETSTDADSNSDSDESHDGDAMDDDDSMAEDSMADDDAMSDEAMSEDSMAEDEAMSDDDAMAEDDAMSDEDDAIEDFFSDVTFVSLFWPEGTEPSAEVLGCINSKGVDPEMSPFEASEDEMNAASIVITGCAPSEMAESMSSEVTPPAGTTIEDVKCVMRETFSYIGTLPVDVAIAMTDSTESNIPVAMQEEITPTAESACNLSADQIEAIFAA